MSLTHRRLFERCSAFTKYTWRADINMASQQPICEQLISVPAHQPRQIMNGMIGTMTTVSRNKPTSTPTVRLGDFAKLPLEILHFTFSIVDFLALLNITRTCRRGTAVVASIREFRDLVQYGPRAIPALASTKLLHCHSAYLFHAALLSKKSVSCGWYGAFLF